MNGDLIMMYKLFFIFLLLICSFMFYRTFELISYDIDLIALLVNYMSLALGATITVYILKGKD
tara:strand:- start:1481 stop:1669 length:189 start_codon:yes stop_codon:yes gene_type:complete